MKIKIFFLNWPILPDLWLPKDKINMPIASASVAKIQKMGQIICFYVHTHGLKCEAGHLVTFKQG